MPNNNTSFSSSEDTNQEFEYAGFWVRFAAFLLDMFIVFLGTFVLKFIFFIISIFTGFAETEILFSFTLKDIIIYLCQVTYFVILTYNTGSTLGKRAMNLMVIPAHQNPDIQETDSDLHRNKEQLTLLNVIYRETIGRYLSAVILNIGYLITILDKENRALHDILCDTRVIYAKKIKIYPEYQMPIMHPVSAGYNPDREPFEEIKPYSYNTETQLNNQNEELHE
ncbi:MAG: RDD family protein [Bariatricus sp.]|nr:RDD family protein [Bariatricus sp.]